MTGRDRKPGPEQTAREARRAEALRANLQRRKAQARGRAEPPPPESAAGDKPGTSARDR